MLNIPGPEQQAAIQLVQCLHCHMIILIWETGGTCKMLGAVLNVLKVLEVTQVLASCKELSVINTYLVVTAIHPTP